MTTSATTIPASAPTTPGDASLSGRVALVTGGGRGIGRAVALDLAARGAAVAVVARSRDQVDAVVADIEAAGGRALGLAADLAELGSLHGLVDAVVEGLGPVDVLVNNAGTVGPLGPTEDLAADEVELTLRLNVTAVVLLTGAVVPGMRERGWGRVVNVSSGIVAGPAAMVGGGVYAASKSALEAHTVNLAAELAGSGISANVYRPGRVDTAMQEWIRGQDPDRVGGGLVERFVESHLSGELITPEYSARALVRRLVGDESGAVWDVMDE